MEILSVQIENIDLNHQIIFYFKAKLAPGNTNHREGNRFFTELSGKNTQAGQEWLFPADLKAGTGRD